MTKEVKKQVTEENEETNTTYSFERILNLGVWAKITSRTFYIIGIAILIFHLYDFLINFNPQFLDSSDILVFLVIFGVCLLFIFLGLILQFIVEGIYLLVDIEQNTRNK